MDWHLTLFPKFFADLDPAGLAALSREVGLDGVNAVVRQGMWIEPDRLTRQLPAFVEAVQAAGGAVRFVTTGYQPEDLVAHPEYLDAIAATGIDRFRLGYLQYEPGQVHELVQRARENLAALAPLCAQRGLTALLQLHGGTIHQSFSAAWRLIEHIGLPGIGLMADPGNMVHQEGYENFRYGFDLVGARVGAMGIKDVCFTRQTAPAEAAGTRWQKQWCSIADGLVDWPEVMRVASEHGMRGPLVFHPFYHDGHRDRQICTLRREVSYLREVLAGMDPTGRDGQNA